MNRIFSSFPYNRGTSARCSVAGAGRECRPLHFDLPLLHHLTFPPFQSEMDQLGRGTVNDPMSATKDIIIHVVS